MKVVIRWLCAGAALLMIAACSRSEAQKSTEVVEPLWLGVAYDVSRSAQPLPELTMEHVKRLLEVLEARGGSIAVGLVDESGFKPLTRLRLETVAGRLDERAKLHTKNKKTAEEFLTKVEGMLTQGRNASRTDVKGTIGRLGLFFGEPNIPAGAEKVLLFISDGADNAHWQGSASNNLPADVAVYVVGMEKGLAEKWFGGQAVLFESPEAALENLDRRS